MLLARVAGGTQSQFRLGSDELQAVQRLERVTRQDEG